MNLKSHLARLHLSTRTTSTPSILHRSLFPNATYPLDIVFDSTLAELYILRLSCLVTFFCIHHLPAIRPPIRYTFRSLENPSNTKQSTIFHFFRFRLDSLIGASQKVKGVSGQVPKDTSQRQSSDTAQLVSGFGVGE